MCEFVAVLFADIEGFSKLKADEVEIFTDEVLNSLAHRVIQGYRDDLIDLNTWGDAIFATSKDPKIMARMALDLRDFFVQPPGGGRIEALVLDKLRIRIAVDFTEARIATNYVLSDDSKTDQGKRVAGCFGRDLTLAARIEPVTPPNTVFATAAFVEVIRDRVPQVRAEEFGASLVLPKRAGRVSVYSLHRNNEAIDRGLLNPLNLQDKIAPIVIDPWFLAGKPRHQEVEARLDECEAGEKARFIAITGHSLIYPKKPGPGQSITVVSAVARAIKRGVRIEGVVLDPESEEAAFRAAVEGNTLLVDDAWEIKDIPENPAWKPVKSHVKENLHIRKTSRGLSFNLWLFIDRAIIEPYHFGKLEEFNEIHMCKFSQLVIYKTRDTEYRMIEAHFKHLWDDAEDLWP